MQSLYSSRVKRPAFREIEVRKRDEMEREHCICVSGTGYFLIKKGGGGPFTCGCDLFRISMTIDLHVWSSIAGYGSRKRCWLGDQKCGQFRMVGRAHFELLSFISFFDFHLIMKHSAMHGSCPFYFITTILLVALDIGYVGITKSVVFSR